MDKGSSSYSSDNSRYFSEKARGKLPERTTHSSPEAPEGKLQEPHDYTKIIEHVLSDKRSYNSDLSNKKSPIMVDAFLHLKERIIDRVVNQQQKANDVGPPYNNQRFKNNLSTQSDCQSAIKRIVQAEDPNKEQKTIVEEWLSDNNKILSNATKYVLEEKRIIDQHENFTKTMENEYNSGNMNNPMNAAFAGIKKELSIIKNNRNTPEYNSRNAEKAHRYMLKAYEKGASHLFTPRFQDSAIPKKVFG